MSLDNKSNYHEISNTNINSTLFDLNANQLIDKNWEIKYLTQLQNKEMNKEISNPVTKDQKNRNSIKSLINDYQQNEEINTHLKNTKIKTKSKYGW
jgi:hypothetical protein